ncbi:DinB superfamily protein [Paenibacillus sp. UNC496MF]|uniref:DinB family protein n=1 Tax=Paenibacillus sp. UNC496MF TaxID=1502753 RepID=UPI0008E38989|nr:DinB family protein [Paenibacillus sp. UNC496MF]SFI37155.1 DinB superfamily protein [Paenibacillus sp. UNC496MF]
MSEIILNSALTLRRIVLQQVDAIPEELFDVQPAGFTNTVRWNVGHLVYWADAYMTLCFGSGSAIPSAYAAFFDSGTKPADWTEAPPSKAELLRVLSAQLDRFADIAPDRLNAPFAPPLRQGPLEFHAAGDLFNFALMHEAMHLAACGSLLKAAVPA